MKILVIHGQHIVVEQIKASLDHLQPIIRYYNSGLDGLIASRMEKFNLIVCSTELPVVTGFELIRSLRNISINKTTPVIFLADRIDEKVEHLGNALGVTELFLNNEFAGALPQLIENNMYAN
jgi:DNA-binding response OmpR family regulator